MGGYSSGSSGAPSGGGTKKQAANYRKKNKPSVIQQIVDASPTVKVIKAIGTGIENIKKEKAADVNLGTSDYQGSPTGKKSRVRTRQVGGGGGGDNNNQNSVVQPKVISQMEAPTPDLTTAGPTEVEMAAVPEVADIELSEDERLKRIKRKGRKSTILARQGLDDKVELSKPTLLG